MQWISSWGNRNVCGKMYSSHHEWPDWAYYYEEVKDAVDGMDKE